VEVRSITRDTNSNCKGIVFLSLAETPKCAYRMYLRTFSLRRDINTLHDKLNPICNLMALLGAHHILHVGGIMVKYIWEELLTDFF